MELIIQLFNELWSIHKFKDPDIDSFAQQQLAAETQQGLKVMSTLLILLIIVAMLLFKQMSSIDNYNLNYFWVIALAAHINVSVRVVSDIKTLHALGMTLLVISATAYVFIAHQAGGFNPLLLANIVLLFMIIPLVPWGLREAFLIVISIYSLLTFSTLSVGNRFDNETLKVLQFFLIAAGTTSLVLVIRSTLIRKQELITHFKLQQAHADMFALSNIDPLTGAWNRRYTETAIDNLIADYKKVHDHIQFIIIDLNDFKSLNDTFGHDFGDRVLIMTSQTIIDQLGDQGALIRIGGDEFIILLVGYAPDRFMRDINIKVDSLVRQVQSRANFGMSWGSVALPMVPVQNMESVYQQADKALYLHKQSHCNRN